MYTIPEGMRNRFFQFPAAVILHQMRIELQFNSQLGAMDVMTRAVLVINPGTNPEPSIVRVRREPANAYRRVATLPGNSRAVTH